MTKSKEETAREIRAKAKNVDDEINLLDKTKFSKDKENEDKED